MSNRFGIVLLGMVAIIAAGCLKKPSEPGTKTAGGGPRPAAGGGNTEGEANPYANMSREDFEERRDGSIFRAGSGGPPAANSGGPGGGESNVPNFLRNQPPAQGGAAGGLANGLYPQFPMSGVPAGGGAVAVGGGDQQRFGGGLYPPGGSTVPANPLLAGSGNPTATPPENQGAASNPSTGAPLSQSNDRVQDPSQPQSEESYMKRAEKAFLDGDEALGVKLLYAHFLCDEGSGEDYTLRWFEGLYGPRLFSRFGVGITYSAPRGFQELPPAIGEPYVDPAANRAAPVGDAVASAGTASGPSGGAGGRDASNSPYARVDTSSPVGMLLYYTGDYGERLYKRLNDRRKHADAYFGPILRELPEPAPTRREVATATSNTAPGQSFGPNYGPGNNPLSMGSGGGGSVPATADPSGPVGAGGNATGPTAGGTLTSKWSLSSPGGAPADDLRGTIIPGVMMLGQGNRETLIRRAREEGIDLLLVFEVTVQQTRNVTQSIVTLRLIDVTDPENAPIVKTAQALQTTKVGEVRSKQTNDRSDPVELALDDVFQRVVDERFKAADFPEGVNEENVTSQVERLSSTAGEKRWTAAVEIIGYLRKGLIRESTAEEAIEKLFGTDGLVLVSGSPTDRKRFLESQLIKTSGGESGQAGDIR